MKQVRLSCWLQSGTSLLAAAIVIALWGGVVLAASGETPNTPLPLKVVGVTNFQQQLIN